MKMMKKLFQKKILNGGRKIQDKYNMNEFERKNEINKKKKKTEKNTIIEMVENMKKMMASNRLVKQKKKDRKT